ncbi:biopolymer transporter ExbD [Celeribacter halophilus]|uniref:Biopolymer transporter ExbD n=1 Tax=Celeribacter halophilus TaxID=576117 RepID=A0AAW7XTU4_9RHOB|nr:biopolymer transporter ExbD [Celeribacter halophilus]MDO6457727.1 biopolymer transporter ExbD [Celeribacter halophilus]MDO6723985.1 biopolymer transporter ExbD [Celeribacter halophilus]
MDFGAPRRKHRMSLTPMIDVVFLLLVFFMLASQFGSPAQLPLTLGGGASSSYTGPARLIRIGEDGLQLNGSPRAEAEIIAALHDLTETPEDMIILRAEEDVPLQQVIETMEWLGSEGYSNLVLVE